MHPIVIILVVAVVIVFFVALVFLLGLPVTGRSFKRTSWKQNMRSIVSAQRSSADNIDQAYLSKAQRTVADTLAEETAIEKVSDSRLTLRKKLKYAQLSSVPPFAFSLCQIATSLMVFLVVRLYLDSMLQIVSLIAGPLFMNWLLMFRVNRRFMKFDDDYPQFLLSLVGLLKTGMNPVQALEAGSQGLEESSLVRQEVELMLERMRLGVPEERSIGSFGEDVYHPEIELFVQALILSRRVGGNLSDTLDRLSKQVRKRQYFRKSANAAVGLQRGSIWFILGILASLELYLYFQWPQVVLVTWKHPTGRMVGQVGLAMIIFGMYWVRQVTKIRV